MLVAAMLLALAALTGCVERRLVITSDPAGAAVFVNDVELGRTPVAASFTYHGLMDVRVIKDGYEPLRTRARASAPLYEYPPVDLAAEALPFEFENTVRWHFTLTPAFETTHDSMELEQGVIHRAADLRSALGQTGPVTSPCGVTEPQAPEPERP
jgi:hypothetical protein